MKLEVGMYIRIRGFISRIGHINKSKKGNIYIQFKQPNGLLVNMNINQIDNGVKASFNIIDLIQVGDYVNSYKVVDKVNNWKIIVDHLELDTKDGNYYNKYFFEKDIKTIVTKEMYQNVKYKVSE